MADPAPAASDPRTPPPAAGDDPEAAAALAARLDRFFAESAPLAPGDRLLAAFSGGPDSTALLAALARWAPARGVALAAAHLDHGLDPGSAARAHEAAAAAAALGVPCTVARRPVAPRARPGESPEAAARRVRYGFLESERRRWGARWIVTAHHRDDQAETVLLRLAAGSGATGLAGIRPAPGNPRPAGAAAAAGSALTGGPTGTVDPPAAVVGRVVRPLLALPRATLHRSLAGLPARPVDDPTNRDPARPRNRIRHRLLPALTAREPELAARLAALANAAAGAAAAVERRLAAELAPRPLTLPGGGTALAVERTALAALPAALAPAALALLHRLAGAPYPAGRAGRDELLRQLAAGGAVGCDCGGGWRWRCDGPLLVLARRRREEPRPFTYTLVAPGELEIPELSLRFRLARGSVEGWMFRGERRRAGLALPLGPGEAVTVRSRRPGDRLRPLGAPGERRLKQVLIDRRVPRGERDRLPLLCLGADARRVAWVPGVTIDERYRLAAAGAGETGGAWVAAVEPMESAAGRRRLVG